MFDVNMVLDAGSTVTADGSGDPIPVEGAGLVWACVQGGAMSGASTTLDVRVQFSPDNKVNYYMAGKGQQFGPTDDNKFLRFPIYLPEPEVQGQAGYPLWVRVNYDVAGSSPSYAITKVWLEPILGLGPIEPDETLNEGACLRMASV